MKTNCFGQRVISLDYDVINILEAIKPGSVNRALSEKSDPGYKSPHLPSKVQQ